MSHDGSTRQVTLLSALGNKDLILEFLDFFNGGKRFSYNLEGQRLRERFSGAEIKDIHLICTASQREEVERLRRSIADEYPGVDLHPDFLQCSDIESQADEEEMKKRVYALARKLAANAESRLIISSGGRKTMTNRLIEAGLLYGCEGYLAITAPQHADTSTDIRSQSDTFNILWIPARHFYEQRRSNDIREGIGDNFRSLYILPQTVIDYLRQEKIGLDDSTREEHCNWLKILPKADLHCHLGGAFDPSLLRKMAQKLVEDCGIDTARVQQVVEKRTGYPVSQLTSRVLRDLNPGVRHCLNNLKLLLDPIPLNDGIPALVAGLSEVQVADLSYDGKEMQECRNQDLDWYMACGDLGGSALLQTEPCLRMALSWLLHQSYRDGVRYLEVRCSPVNYCRRGLDLKDVMNILIDEGRRFMQRHSDFTVNFLIMATRHKSQAAMVSHVSAAVCFAGENGQEQDRIPRVVGFDLAGQEEDHDPVRFKELFMPLHHHFINITIHAGEMESDDKIWQALYLLHAKRIGHGLKLINNKRMMNYIRDYGTAVEMCPSSNLQTNNFQLPPARESGARYPLKDYLEHGIAVTVNTDNLGISSTRLSREYWLAARLSEGGLSYWQILRMIKNSFRAVFLPKDEKDRLLKKVDEQVFRIIMNEFFQETWN